MSLRTRIQSLEKAIRLADPTAECVINVTCVVVGCREDVVALQAAGLLEDIGSGQGSAIPPRAGPVRLAIAIVEAADVLKSRNQ